MDARIGDLIAESRKTMGLTQDQFGRKYGVSGPAVFKFEKNYVKPSLQLWMLIAKDLEITEQETVLMWIRAKLPKKYQEFVTLATASAKEHAKEVKAQAAKPKKPKDAEEVRKAIVGNRSAAKGLKLLLKDSDFITLYQPTGEEMELLNDVFGPLGDGSKSAYREALRLLRSFHP